MRIDNTVMNFSQVSARGEQLTENPVNAALIKRMSAFIVDSLLFGALVGTLTVIFNVIGTSIGSLLYTSLHDNVMGKGRSVGRSAVGQRLIHTSGHEVSHLTAVLRNALRWFLWTTGILFIVDLALFFSTGRLIADYVLKTMVAEDPALFMASLPTEATVTDEAILEAERSLDFEEGELEQFDLALKASKVESRAEIKV